MSTIVFSRTLKTARSRESEVIEPLTADLVIGLQAEKAKDILLFGGSGLFRSFLDYGGVDEIEGAVIPVLLGAESPLLLPPYTPAMLRLLNHHGLSIGKVRCINTVESVYGGDHNFPLASGFLTVSV